MAAAAAPSPALDSPDVSSSSSLLTCSPHEEEEEEGGEEKEEERRRRSSIKMRSLKLLLPFLLLREVFSREKSCS